MHSTLQNNNNMEKTLITQPKTKPKLLFNVFSKQFFKNKKGLTPYSLQFTSYRFLERKTSLFTWSGFSDERRQVTTFPPVQTPRSDAALVAGMHRYFLASLESRR